MPLEEEVVQMQTVCGRVHEQHWGSFLQNRRRRCKRRFLIKANGCLRAWAACDAKTMQAPRRQVGEGLVLRFSCKCLFLALRVVARINCNQ